MTTDRPARITASLLLMACISCGEDAESGVITSTCTTESGKTFTVASKPFSASLAVVSLETEGFDVDEVYELGALDPIETIFLADLNRDGFQEIYITTRSAGSGSYSSIFGVASNKDRSSSPVHLAELERGELLEGFMGHNQFALEDDVLVETFPVYEKGDVNITPSGGEGRIQYSLINGEAGWRLKPVTHRLVTHGGAEEPEAPADCRRM